MSGRLRKNPALQERRELVILVAGLHWSRLVALRLRHAGAETGP